MILDNGAAHTFDYISDKVLIGEDFQHVLPVRACHFLVLQDVLELKSLLLADGGGALAYRLFYG